MQGEQRRACQNNVALPAASHEVGMGLQMTEHPARLKEIAWAQATSSQSGFNSAGSSARTSLASHCGTLPGY